jgi:phosphonopyruvate decarboxylase
VIEAADFVDCARDFGYRYYAGVPCSFLTPLINYVIADQSTFVSSANEGDAVATCAGAVLGGRKAVVMMQNSGLGNAINPLTSLTHVFRLPILLLVTLRGDPDLNDEPQHRLMGRITGRLLDTMEIPWEYFPTKADRIEAVFQRAEDYMARELRPYALLVRKGSIARNGVPSDSDEAALSQLHHFCNGKSLAPVLQRRLRRGDVLRRVVELTPERKTVVIATTGHTGRELYAVADRSNQLYMVGSMGCASSLGLGLAMARPDLRVVVIDGDGAALMRMGNFATVGAYGRANLIHILLDNEVHDSTGAQATVSPGVAFAHIAEACGYAMALEGDELGALDALFTERPHHAGARFGHIKIRPGSSRRLPRPELSPSEVRQRLMTHIGAHLPFVRAAA